MQRRRAMNQMFHWLNPVMQQRYCSTSNRSIRVCRRLTQNDVDQFATLSGDTNFIHSRQCPPEQRCIHGALLNGLVSGVIGTELPGPGSIVLSQSFSFPNKCVVDEDIIIIVQLVADRKIKKVSYECHQNGQIVFKGTADLIHRGETEI